MAFQAGEIVGDYEILGTLGKGGMGAVYRVRNIVSDRVEAMKELLPDLAQDPDLAERFLREIRVHAALHHPNIAQLLTAFRRSDRLLMIMELVEGVTLDQVLHRGPIPYGEAAEYIAQTLNALSYAHGRGVIHRDIKPANIAVLPDGTVKLLDFGIARGKADQRITLSGMVVGSLLYMSPEQVSGSPVDARSDLYSVGITLYQAVTGVQPFRGESQFAVMQAQLSHIPDPPAGIAPGVPAGLSDAIMRAIEKDPARRFASAAEFQTAVEPFRSGETRTALAGGVGAPAPAERIRSTSQIDSSTLEAIARNLAQFVGPIARRLVDTRSRKTASVEELCHDLANEIVAPGDRTSFLRACREQVPAGMGTGSRPGSAPGLPAAIDPGLIECARKELASYTGPLAKVIVDRMLKKARTADELITRLGEEIDSKPDRERFLRALRQFGR